MKQIGCRREYLMGVSILLIMFCHNTIKWTVYSNLFYVFAQLAQCGVDIFLFLSGYGLYHSYQKRSGCEFVKRRIDRILPTYLVLMGGYIVFIAILGGDVGKTIWDMSLISFFVEGNLSVWFVSAILLLYLLFPLLY